MVLVNMEWGGITQAKIQTVPQLYGNFHEEYNGCSIIGGEASTVVP